MKKTMTILAVTALVATLSTVALARGPQKGGPEGRGMKAMVPLLTEYLDLTEAQQAQWAEQREDARAQIEPLQQEGKAIRKQVREALEAGDADPQAIGTLMVRGHEIRQQVKSLREAAKESFEELLTADQKAHHQAFADLQKTKRELRRERRGARGGNGPQGEGGPDA